MKTFSISEALRFGWGKFRNTSGILIVGALVLTLINLASGFFEPQLRVGVNISGMLLCFILSFIFTVGFNRVCLRIARGEAVQARDLIPSGKLVWVYLLASILQMLAVVGGLILLIIPGFYLMVRLYFVGFSVIDGASPVQALQQSNRMTLGVFWRLAGFILIQLALTWLGSFVYIGTLITLPLLTLASAHIYLKLKQAA